MSKHLKDVYRKGTIVLRLVAFAGYIGIAALIVIDSADTIDPSETEESTARAIVFE